MKWLDVLGDSERRTAPRKAEPSILVYYWDGSVPQTHAVRDISLGGAFVNTKERWYIGTLVRLTLVLDRGDAIDPAGEMPESESISMFAKAVRHETDGVGVEFVTARAPERAHLREFLAKAAALPARTRAAIENGQALVEFALVLPLILLFIVNVFNFGGYLYDWITVANAARAATQYGVLGGASVGGPNSPSSAQITALVTQDVYSLPNKASVSVVVCTNSTIAAVNCPGAAALPADPEAPLYSVTSVDVTYTYVPFVSLWNFNARGIHATLPATTIHRRSIMRAIQ